MTIGTLCFNIAAIIGTLGFSLLAIAYVAKKIFFDK